MKILKFLRELGLRLILIGLSVFVTLVVIEFGLRLFYPQQLIVFRPDIWQPVEGGRGYNRAPNLNTIINTGERSISLMSDEQGFRIGQESPSANPDIKILAIGDSFLEALQVNYEDTMTAVLEARLSQELNTTVRIYNSGVGGYTPNHYAIVAEQELAANDYDMLIVFIYAGNDTITESVDSFPPRESSLREFRFPSSFSRSEIVNGVLYPINDWLERNSHLFILFRNSSRVFLAQIGLSAYYFPETVLTKNQDAPFWDTTVERFADIQALGAENDIPVLFVIIPAELQVSESSLEWRMEAFKVEANQVNIDLPSLEFVPRMSEANLVFMDTLSDFRLASEAGLDDLYGKVDGHLDIDGHALIAELLLPLVLQNLEN